MIFIKRNIISSIENYFELNFKKKTLKIWFRPESPITEQVIFKFLISAIVEKMSPGSHVLVAETKSNISLFAYKGISRNIFIPS